MKVQQPALSKLLIYAKIDSTYALIDQSFGDPEEIMRMARDRKTANVDYLVIVVTYVMEDAIVIS